MHTSVQQQIKWTLFCYTIKNFDIIVTAIITWWLSNKHEWTYYTQIYSDHLMFLKGRKVIKPGLVLYIPCHYNFMLIYSRHVYIIVRYSYVFTSSNFAVKLNIYRLAFSMRRFTAMSTAIHYRTCYYVHSLCFGDSQHS